MGAGRRHPSFSRDRMAANNRPKRISKLSHRTHLKGNPNIHTERGSQMVTDSIQAVGFADSMTVDRDGVVLSGNQRLDSLGEAQLGNPIVIQSDGTRPIIHQRTDLKAGDERARMLAILANRSQELNLEWSPEMLKLLDVDLSGMWTKAELEELFAGIDGSTGEEKVDPVVLIDRAKELQQKWRVQCGQTFEIGPHRLICGDCTDPEIVGKNHADLCLTDPPYGVGEAYESFNDTPENLKRLIYAFMPIAKENADRILLTPGNLNQRLYPVPEWTLCWFVAAGTSSSPWGFTCWQPILAYGKDPYLQAAQGRRPDAFSLTESADNSLGHPCSKPVGPWCWLMERGSIHKGDVVLDLFAGSGTGFIAAHRLGRVMRGVEIEPKYCAVILERLENAGLRPQLVT